MVDAALSQKQAEIHRPPCLIEEGWFHEAQWMKEGSWRPSTRANSLRRRRWLTRQTESLVTWQCMQNMGCCGQAWAGGRSKDKWGNSHRTAPPAPPKKKRNKKHTKQPTQTRQGRRTEKDSRGGGAGGEKQRQARKKKGRRKKDGEQGRRRAGQMFRIRPYPHFFPLRLPRSDPHVSQFPLPAPRLRDWV